MYKIQNISLLESTDYYPIVLIPNSVKDYVMDYIKYCKEFEYPYINPGELLNPQIQKKLKDIKNKKESLTLSVLQHNPTLKEPVKPSEPIRPQKPEKFRHITIHKSRLNDGDGVLIFFVDILIAIVIFLISPILLLNLVIPLVVISIVVYSYFKNKIIQIQKTIEISETEYADLLNKFKNENDNYNESLILYPQKIAEYNSKSMIYNSCLNKLENDYLFNNYRISCEAKIKPSRAINYPQKGKIENSFLEYLIKYFGTNIKINMAISVSSSFFYPDYIYISMDNKIYFDIEIDEQYDFINKLPIHYIGSDDESRNDYFLKNNWFIIRLTEEQARNYPDECCNFIKEIITLIENPVDLPKINHKIPKMKRWTYEEIYLTLNKTKGYNP